MVKVDAVIGSKSSVLVTGSGVKVEKPDGGVISLLCVKTKK